MGDTIMQSLEYNKNIPIKAHFDTIVVGGGIAGVSAAVAASRQGANVLLVEKTVMLGGLATTGIIIYYLPLCNGLGRKVTGGIAEELLHLSIKYGHSTLPDGWKMGNDNGPTKRYMSMFNPASFTIALDELVISEGITLLLDTNVCDVVTKGNKISGIITSNSDGLCMYSADSFVDASGQALLFWQAGDETVAHKNFMSYWAQSIDLNSLNKATQSGDIGKAIKVDDLFFNAMGKDHDGNFKKESYLANSGDDVTQFILDGRKGLLKDEELLKQGKKAWITLPGMVQYRKIRRIKSPYVLSETDVNKRFENSIGVVSDWRKPGPIYEIPFNTLYGKYDNLLAAGRCIGAKGDAWEVVRCIPQVALTGQGAGVAAAMISDSKMNASDLDIKHLQSLLTKQGVMLHF